MGAFTSNTPGNLSRIKNSVNNKENHSRSLQCTYKIQRSYSTVVILICDFLNKKLLFLFVINFKRKFIADNIKLPTG